MTKNQEIITKYYLKNKDKILKKYQNWNLTNNINKEDSEELFSSLLLRIYELDKYFPDEKKFIGYFWMGLRNSNALFKNNKINNKKGINSNRDIDITELSDFLTDEDNYDEEDDINEIQQANIIKEWVRQNLGEEEYAIVSIYQFKERGKFIEDYLKEYGLITKTKSKYYWYQLFKKVKNIIREEFKDYYI